MTAKIGPFDIAVVIELPAIRPNENEGRTVLNRYALRRMAREIAALANNTSIEAIKITLSESVITIQRATRRP